MAITEDASTPPVVTGSGAGTLTTAAFSPPAGATLVVLVAGGYGTATTGVSVTDSSSQTWYTAATATGTAANRGVAAVFFTDILAAALTNITVTATFTGLSGGRLLTVRVLNNTKQGQPGVTNTAVNSTATTSGTVSVTTTQTGSVVYGVSDDPDVADTWTPNGATTVVGAQYNDSPDGVTLVGWKATAATGTPGSVTLGGTWSAAARSNTAVAEFLPAPATQTVSPTGADVPPRVGAVVVTATVVTAPVGVPTGVVTGGPTVTTTATVTPVGVGTDRGTGAAQVIAATAQTVSPTGVDPGVTVGAPGVAFSQPLAPAGAEPPTPAGNPALTVGPAPQPTSPTGVDLPPQTAPGAVTVTTGPVTVTPTGAVTGTVAGAALVIPAQPQTVSPTGVPTVAQVGVAAAVFSQSVTATSVVASTAPGVVVVGTPPPFLAVTFWALYPDGSYNVPLPDVSGWALSPMNGSPGAVTLDYPTAGRNFSVLRASVTQDKDLQVAIWVAGKDPGSLRALLNTTDGDDVTEAGIWRFSGNFLPVRMEEAVITPRTVVVSPPTGPNPTTDLAALRVYSVTAGTLMATLMQEARGRGTLTDVTWRFTPVVDSQGVPWSKTTTLKLSPGLTLAKVLESLVGASLCEWDVTWNGSSTELVLWEYGTRGVDRTTTPDPLILRAGRDLRDSPRKHSVRGAGTTLLVAGAEGFYSTVTDPTAVARRGRRIERYESQGGLTDPGSLLAYGTAKLPQVTAGVMEVGSGVALAPGAPLPLLDYNVGDWVYEDTGSGLERLRIAQLTLTGDQHGTITVGLSLHDLLADDLTRLSQRLDGIVGGSTITGTSNATPVAAGPDTVAPAAPTGLVVTSLAQPSAEAVPRSAVFAAWAAVITNADGTACSDLAGYVVQFRYTGAQYTNNWVSPSPQVPTEAASWSGVVAGAVVEVRVAAVDRSLNQSTWSAPSVFHTTQTDMTPPPAPSTPVVTGFLGTLTVTWDGLGSAGEVMPPDFAGVEIHRSLTSSFTPTTATLVETMVGAGSRNYPGLPYGVTQFFRLVTYDRTGNKNPTPSTQGSGTPTEIGYADIAFKDAGNLVQDGSFELAGSRATHLGRSDPAWAMVTGGADLGSWYAQGTGSTGSGERVLLLSPLVPATTGTQYAVQLAVQRDTACNGTLLVRLRFHLTGGGVSDVATTYTTGETAGAWLAKTATPYVAPALTESMEVMVVLGSTMTLGHWSVDRVEVREMVGTLLVQDAAITNAKVSDLSVGKLTAGTITAVMLMAGMLRSGTTGYHYEQDAFGIRFYGSDGTTVTIRLDGTTGTATLTGTLQTGTSGRRIVVSGADGDIKFYPQAGETRYGRVFSYIPGNYPNDIALEMRAIDSASTVSRSRTYLLPDRAAFVVSPTGNDLAPQSIVELFTDHINIELRHWAPAPGDANDSDGGYVYLDKASAKIGYSGYQSGGAFHVMGNLGGDVGFHRLNGRWYNHTNLGPDEAILLGEVFVASGFSGGGVAYGPTMSTLMIAVASLDGPTAVAWCVNNNSATGFSVNWAGTEGHWIRWSSWKV